ncbi:hypothetical protein ACFY8O_24080 [Streptomyces argenteolus]|uniref:Uncharacterized protein n=1 Tax=Streptomyces argenteolus TaxID=67274 RepID=A0ABW6XA73_9ACTN
MTLTLITGASNGLGRTTIAGLLQQIVALVANRDMAYQAHMRTWAHPQL